MGAILSGTASLGTGFAQATTVVGTALWSGIIFVADAFAALGAYFFACFAFLFGCCTTCASRTSTELLRPATDWGDSEAKRGGGLCCCACALVCLFTILSSLIIAYAGTLAWYGAVGLPQGVQWQDLSLATTPPTTPHHGPKPGSDPMSRF